jgi:hypothetical protein
MPKFGVHLSLLIGASVPAPAPASLVEALERVEVTHSDEGRSGFQLTFKAGRGQPYDQLDYPLLRGAQLKPFSRAILVVTFGARPSVLMDGIITHQELVPGNQPGASILSVTGEDVSLMMDLEEKVVAHPAQNEFMIAEKIIGSYAQYGLIPAVVPPPLLDTPLPTERIPVQHGTDLEYLQDMAARYAYVFYLTPGPVPGTNSAYWGPPKRVGQPQSALTVNMGEHANVESINFRYNGLAPHTTVGRLQDRNTNKVTPLRGTSSRTPLAKQQALRSQTQVRQRWLSDLGGLNSAQARARAVAHSDASLDTAVTAEGELDAIRYGRLLEAHGLVGVRGVGDTYDGLYYVEQVTHVIEAGSYKQRFCLSRDGVGSLTPAVPP